MSDLINHSMNKIIYQPMKEIGKGRKNGMQSTSHDDHHRQGYKEGPIVKQRDSEGEQGE